MHYIGVKVNQQEFLVPGSYYYRERIFLIRILSLVRIPTCAKSSSKKPKKFEKVNLHDNATTCHYNNVASEFSCCKLLGIYRIIKRFVT
jgi:hypothetical protein